MKGRWNCRFFFLLNQDKTLGTVWQNGLTWLWLLYTPCSPSYPVSWSARMQMKGGVFRQPVVFVSACEALVHWAPCADGVAQKAFSQAHYEGRAALPHPPAIVTWTRIKSQPSLKCCERPRRSHHNPNIRRHLAVESAEQFEVRHYNESWLHQTGSGGLMEDLLCRQDYSWFSECNLNKYITVT